MCDKFNTVFVRICQKFWVGLAQATAHRHKMGNLITIPWWTLADLALELPVSCIST